MVKRANTYLIYMAVMLDKGLTLFCRWGLWGSGIWSKLSNITDSGRFGLQPMSVWPKIVLSSHPYFEDLSVIENESECPHYLIYVSLEEHLQFLNCFTIRMLLNSPNNLIQNLWTSRILRNHLLQTPLVARKRNKIQLG